MSAPHELRMERIKNRVYEQHGERVLKGGDMYEQTQKFLSFVASRPLSKIKQWANTLTCPIIHIDGTVDFRVNAINIAKDVKSLRQKIRDNNSVQLLNLTTDCAENK